MVINRTGSASKHLSHSQNLVTRLIVRAGIVRRIVQPQLAWLSELDERATERYDAMIARAKDRWKEDEALRVEVCLKLLTTVAALSLSAPFISLHLSDRILGSGHGRELSDEGKIALIVFGMLALGRTKKLSKKHSENKKFKRLKRSREFEHRVRQLDAVYQPENVPQLTPIGGKLGQLASVLNLDPSAMEVEGVGVRDGLTTETYVLKVCGLNNYTDIFKLRGQVATALRTQEAITFNFANAGLEVEVSKPLEQCVYPVVTDYVGNDNHRIILPAGVKDGQLYSYPIDDSFSTQLIVGMSGSGKTYSLKAILQFWSLRHTPESLQFAICEPQREKSANFLPEEWHWDRHLAYPLANSPISTLRVMAAAIRESSKRREMFKAAGVFSLSEYNRKMPLPLPTIVVVVDEPEELLDERVQAEEIRAVFIRMVLIIARLCRAMGVKLMLMPKSIAASEEDSFPVELRRVLNPNGMAMLVATMMDGCIALQADPDQDYLAREAVNLPGRGAAIIRQKGQLYRVQMLSPVKDHRKLQGEVLGHPRVPTAEGEWDLSDFGELPSVIEIFERYSHPEIPEDEELTIELAKTGHSYQELMELAKGRKRPLKQKVGAKEEIQPQSLSIEDYRVLYRRYWQLRIVEQRNMTDCIQAISGLTPSSQGFKTIANQVDHALYLHLAEIIKALPSEWSDSQIMIAVWGDTRNPKRKENILSEIRRQRNESDPQR